MWRVEIIVMVFCGVEIFFVCFEDVWGILWVLLLVCIFFVYEYFVFVLCSLFLFWFCVFVFFVLLLEFCSVMFLVLFILNSGLEVRWVGIYYCVRLFEFIEILLFFVVWIFCLCFCFWLIFVEIGIGNWFIEYFEEYFKVLRFKWFF